MRTHRQTDTPQCYVLSPATHSAILLHVHINNHDHRLTSLQRMVTHLCRMTWWSVCGRLSGQYMSKERDDRHPGSCPASKRRCEVEWSEIATGWAQTCNVWSTTSRLQQIDRTECLWHRQHDRVTVSLCLSVSLSLSLAHTDTVMATNALTHVCGLWWPCEILASISPLTDYTQPFTETHRMGWWSFTYLSPASSFFPPRLPLPSVPPCPHPVQTRQSLKEPMSTGHWSEWRNHRLSSCLLVAPQVSWHRKCCSNSRARSVQGWRTWSSGLLVQCKKYNI